MTPIKQLREILRQLLKRSANIITPPIIVNLDKRKPANRDEARYFKKLKADLDAERIAYCAREQFKIVLGNRCTYLPDFIVIRNDMSVEFHEFKGFMREEAIIKLKVSAMLHSGIKFILVKRIAKKNGGGFSTVTIQSDWRSFKQMKEMDIYGQKKEKKIPNAARRVHPNKEDRRQGRFVNFDS